MKLSSVTVQPSSVLNYAYFVKAAYDLFRAHPTVLNPSQNQYTSFPAGYKLVSNIQMVDFFGPIQEKVFYGFIAQSLASPSTYVLAIRGTVTYMEWWDDFHIEPTPYPYATKAGNVATGFLDLYESMTMTVPGSNEPAVALRKSIKPSSGGSFSLAGADSLILTGHSLGAALVTLYGAEFAGTKTGASVAIYTLASPKTGDLGFVTYFDSLISESYRVYNLPDVVPTLPPGFGYTQVPMGIGIDSLLNPNVKWNLGCFHALVTYMYILGGPLSLLGTCRSTS